MDSRDSNAEKQWVLSYLTIHDSMDTAAYKYPYTKYDHPTPATVLTFAWNIRNRGGHAIDIKQGSHLIFDKKELSIALDAISRKGAKPKSSPGEIDEIAEQVIQEMGKE